jgi:hypothetical protein
VSSERCSLMGVVLVFWANGGSILKTLFGG